MLCVFALFDGLLFVVRCVLPAVWRLLRVDVFCCWLVGCCLFSG